MDEISVAVEIVYLKGMTSPTFLTNSATRLIQLQKKSRKTNKPKKKSYILGFLVFKTKEV